MDIEWAVAVRVAIEQADSTVGAPVGVRAPLLLVVPANAYLHTLLPRVLAFYATHMANGAQRAQRALASLWLATSTGNALQWDLPVGVALGAQGALGIFEGSVHQGHVVDLVLRMGDYPPDALPVPTSQRVTIDTTNFHTVDHTALDLAFLERHWLNRVKEACYMLNGNANVLMKMAKAETARWWAQGVLEADADVFRRFLLAIVPQTPKNLPLYLHHEKKVHRPVVRDSTTTVRELLCHLGLVHAGLQVWVSAITIPLETPLIEIYKRFASPDLSLHMFTFQTPPGSSSGTF